MRERKKEREGRVNRRRKSATGKEHEWEEERCDGNGNKFNAQLDVVSKYLLYASIEFTGYLLQYVECYVKCGEREKHLKADIYSVAFEQSQFP